MTDKTAEQFIAEANALAMEYITAAMAMVAEWKPKADALFNELQESDLPEPIKLAIIETMARHIEGFQHDASNI